MANFKKGDNALILGGGPVGISILQVLELRGANLVMVSELMESRKRASGRFGPSHVLDPTEVDVQHCQLKPEGMITDKIKMDDVVEKGFKTLIEDRNKHCKIIADVQA